MFNISSFLERFKKIYTEEVEIRKVISEVCESVAGIQCATKQVVVKGTLVYIEVPPLVKNHLFIRKEKILLELQKRIPGRVSDIK